ncbi:MAG: T9SS type A sorting domain-containing protein [Chloroherpetonaceae bacterium]|nr:T9SS type A sorting domain-containing protein [Chloroherpetonaceae bacterium]
MTKTISLSIFICCALTIAPISSVAQFSGITGTGDGINYQYYGTITTALNEIRPFGIYATSIDVYIDFWQFGFTPGVDLSSATLYYKVNSPVFGAANDASWTQVSGVISAVTSSNNDRATFTLTGIPQGTDIMFYIRAQTNTGGFRDGYAYPGQSSWSTTPPNSQAQTYKIRFNKSAAYNTIRIDGRPHDWQSTSQISPRSTSSATRTLDVMWDNDYIYFLINDGFSASANDRIHFGFDLNPGAGGNANGTTTNFSGASFPENYRPDIIFRARGTGLGTWTNDRAVADGSNGWTYTADIGNSPTSDMWSESGSNVTLLEVRIARSAIGSFTSLGVFVWLSNSSDLLYDSFPHGNPSASGLMPIQIGFPNLNDGTTPSASRYYDGQYSHASNFDLFGITTYRDLRISCPTGVEIGISNSLAGLTIARDLRVDANATFRPRAVQTITMTGAQGNIINNGFINASPAFANDLNFIIDSVITLSGSNPVDVFNLTVNAGDTLKVTGTNLRSGNTGTITVNGVIEFGETNFAGAWSSAPLVANFSLNSGATLITANERGVNGDNPSSFNGSIRVNGTVTYHAGASYVFSRNGDQSVGFASQGSLPAIAQANRIATLTRPTTRQINLGSNFVVTASVSQPALNIGSNTTLNIGAFNLEARGDIAGAGAVSGTGKLIVQNAPATVQMSGITVSNFELNDADGIALTGNPTIQNSLLLENGVVSTGANVISVANPALNAIQRTSGYVNNRLARAFDNNSGSRLYPLGDATTYRPISLVGQSASGSILRGELVSSSANALASVTSPLVKVSDLRYYAFQNTGTNAIALSQVQDMAIHSDDEALSDDNNTTLKIATRATGSWASQGPNVVDTNPLPVLSGFNSNAFSATLSSGENFFVALGTTSLSDNPLPVSLIDFAARATTRGIELLWRTATEQDNLGFVVLRNGEELASYLTSPNLRGNGTTLTESRYEFLDAAVEARRVYSYRLRSVDLNGAIHDYDLTATATAIEKILSHRLFQNYPNPFNPATAIRYDLPEASHVKLEIFDMLGRKVATLVDARQSAGSYVVSFDASRFSLASGMYLYRLSAGAFVAAKKMLLTK